MGHRDTRGHKSRSLCPRAEYLLNIEGLAVLGTLGHTFSIFENHESSSEENSTKNGIPNSCKAAVGLDFLMKYINKYFQHVFNNLKNKVINSNNITGTGYRPPEYRLDAKNRKHCIQIKLETVSKFV